MIGRSRIPHCAVIGRALAAALWLSLPAFPALAQEAADEPAPAQAQPPALVRLSAVKKETVQQRWDVVGRLREARRTTVAAELSGKIVEMPVEEGAAVEAGKTVIARIDDTWLKLDRQQNDARLAEAQAAIAEVEALLEQYRRDLDYLQSLRAGGNANDKEVRDADARVRSTSARLHAAKAVVTAIEAANARIAEQTARLNIVAPFDGVVVRKMAEVGQWAAVGTPVVEIVSSGMIDAVVDVPEQIINNLKVGDEIEVRVEALGGGASGKITAIVPEGGNAARTFPVKVALDDQGGSLKPGMSVVAHVPTAKRVEVLTVPRDAISRSPTGDVVWADMGGMALPRSVRVLFGVGDRYAVEPIDTGSGPPLAEGMSVVIEGAERLWPTRPIMNAEAPPPSLEAGPAPEAGPTAAR